MMRIHTVEIAPGNMMLLV